MAPCFKQPGSVPVERHYIVNLPVQQASDGIDNNLKSVKAAYIISPIHQNHNNVSRLKILTHKVTSTQVISRLWCDYCSHVLKSGFNANQPSGP